MVLKRKLTIAEQRKIIGHNFHKLKNRYFSEEQKRQVYLGELERDFWLEHKPRGGGRTHYRRKDKIMWVFVRLWHKRPIKLKKLLEIIAHEMAHVWLNFADPKKHAQEEHKHGEEHKEKLKEYYQYLINNLEIEEKEIIKQQELV